MYHSRTNAGISEHARAKEMYLDAQRDVDCLSPSQKSMRTALHQLTTRKAVLAHTNRAFQEIDEHLKTSFRAPG